MSDLFKKIKFIMIIIETLLRPGNGSSLIYLHLLLFCVKAGMAFNIENALILLLCFGTKGVPPKEIVE